MGVESVAHDFLHMMGQVMFDQDKMALYRDMQEISIAVAAGATHEVISLSLRQRYPSRSGYSTRSVRRFCAQKGIHYRSGLSDEELDRVVASRILSVSHSYGRRTMHGLLSADGVHVGVDRVGRSLQRVAPGPHVARTRRARRHLNPPPYSARFFGDKVHFDQNEKLAMYGVTHVMAVNGFSRKNVGMISIPLKNTIAIYHALIRPLLICEGLWQQVRLDHGTEFALVIKVQQLWQDTDCGRIGIQLSKAHHDKITGLNDSGQRSIRGSIIL